MRPTKKPKEVKSPENTSQEPSAREVLKGLRRMALKVVQGELIGREVRATHQKSGKMVKGTIVDETRDTLVVEHAKKMKTLIKDQHDLEFLEGDHTVKIKGSLIARRPEDRLKIKIRW